MDSLPDLTVWRAILITGFAIAVYTGRPPRLIIAVMVGNFAATWYLAADPLAVGVADAASAVVLLHMRTVQSWCIVALFSVMIIVYVSDWLYNVRNFATYTIIDLIAFLQLGVIGGLDGGIRRWIARRRAAGDRPFAFARPVVYIRRNAQGGGAMDSAPMVSEGNGS